MATKAQTKGLNCPVSPKSPRKAKSNPNVRFKIRDPETGLFLGRKPSGAKWIRSSWQPDGATYPTRDKAQAIIDHYVLVTGDRATPLEVVEFRLSEAGAVVVTHPVLEPLRDFIEAHANRYRLRRDRTDSLWSAIKKGEITGYLFDAYMQGERPKYVAMLSGKHDPVQSINLNGHCEGRVNNGHPRTYVGLNDDSALVALKLAHGDDILQVWDFATGTLIEGNLWIVGK